MWIFSSEEHQEEEEWCLQVLSLKQVEKGHTSLFSAFKINFQHWLKINTESTNDWEAASASSFVRAVVRIDMPSAKMATTASL